MKELKIKKGTIKLIGLVILSTFLLFILFWLGFSFFSMKSEKPLFKTLVDISSEEVAQKVVYSRDEIDTKYVKYTFPLSLLEVSPQNSGYIIKAVDKDFPQYFEDIEEAQFEYLLEKSKGEYDFTKLEWENKLNLVLTYRVDYDFRYFLEYAMCTLNKVYSNILGFDNDNTKGFCFVKRDYVKWEIVELDELLEE